MIAKIIINKNSALVSKLIQSGRTDLNVISLILCETYFRKNTDRLIEYVAMPFLLLINQNRFNRLSIGIGQIQLRHWMRIKHIKKPISIKSYLVYLSVLQNYDVIKVLIQSNLDQGNNDSKLIAVHTGETRKFHYDLFSEIKKLLKTAPNTRYI